MYRCLIKQPDGKKRTKDIRDNVFGHQGCNCKALSIVPLGTLCNEREREEEMIYLTSSLRVMMQGSKDNEKKRKEKEEEEGDRQSKQAEEMKEGGK